MSWVDLFSIDTFTAGGREVREAAMAGGEVDGDSEREGGGAAAVEVAEAPEQGGDEWDAETLDEVPEVDEIGEAVHDDPPPPPPWRCRRDAEAGPPGRSRSTSVLPP